MTLTAIQLLYNQHLELFFPSHSFPFFFLLCSQLFYFSLASVSKPKGPDSTVPLMFLEHGLEFFQFTSCESGPTKFLKR